MIKQSLEYAISQLPHLSYFVRDHSQEMEEDVMKKHIELYVNDFSLDLKTEGKNAILNLLNLSTTNQHNVFVF
jgi:1,4-dihydroxy-6-naphthoate synthase